MGFLEKLTGWISKDQEELLSFRLSDSQVEGPCVDVPAQAGRHYFRVKLVRMFLKKKVNFGKSWFPAAHSLVKCTFGNSTVEIPSIANTAKLFDQQAGTGDVIAKNFHLTPLLPFNGGSIELVAGLFAMEGDNYLNRVITVMSDFAGLLAVPQLSSALNVAAPLADGLQTLFGASDGRMHLGYHDSFVGAKPDDDLEKEDQAQDYLRAGYIAAIRAPAHKVDKEKLWVVDQLLKQGDSLNQCADFTDHDYMLLHLELREDRDDWDQLVSIKKPFDEAIKAIGEEEEEKAKTQIRLAMVAARTSPDLTRADRIRVIDRLKEDYKKAKQDFQFEGLVDSTGFSLQESMGRAISVNAALESGVPTEDEIYADL